MLSEEGNDLEVLRSQILYNIRIFKNPFDSSFLSQRIQIISSVRSLEKIVIFSFGCVSEKL